MTDNTTNEDTTDSTTGNTVPDLPANANGIDAQSAVNQIGLDDRCAFKIGDAVFRYRGIVLGEVAVDRLSAAAKQHAGRLAISDIWHDYHNDELEIGEWRCEFNQQSHVEAKNDDSADSGGNTADADERQMTISESTARTALMEVEIAIKESGGPNMGAQEACSPLALARQRIEESHRLNKETRSYITNLLKEVANERGVEISDADPLVGGTFQAQQELESALEEESPSQTENE